MSEKNGKVTWGQLTVILGIAITALGFLWSTIEKTNSKIDMVDNKVTEIKIDTAVLKLNVGNLIERINGGSVTIKNETGRAIQTNKD